MNIENPTISKNIKEGSMENDVVRMKEEIRKLASLLDKPEYGLTTWQAAVGTQMTEVRDLMNELLPEKK